MVKRRLDSEPMDSKGVALVALGSKGGFPQNHPGLRGAHQKLKNIILCYYVSHVNVEC
jgi:hypothetical protein